MPNYTENLHLVKPLQSEQYNIDVFNSNADKIDQFAGQVPARALTADKLTTGAKINGVNFKGDTDVVTGAGFYYDTVTYGAGDLAFIYNQDGALELHKSLSAGNIGHNPLTTTGYWEKVELGGSGGRNVGEIIPSALPLTDAGLHLLDGSLLQYGIYKEFIDYIAELHTSNPNANYFCTETEWQTSVTTYGSCGKFVYNATNNTVRLPKVSDILQGTTDVTALGDLVEAGLPNITGETVGIRWEDSSSASGVFSLTTNGGATGYVIGSNGSRGFNFDASRSSSLYKNNFNTVQPQTIKVLYYIVIANSTKTEIQVDIDEIATDLNGKADRDLSNTTPTTSFATAMNTAGIRTVVETYVNGSSGYRIWSDGYCEQWAHKDNWGDISSFTFLKTFKDTNYIVVFNGRKDDSTSNLGITTITTTTINYNNADQSLNGDLLAKGYLASGQY